MQAITIAIGKKGINFFAQYYLVDHLLTLVNKLAPPGNTIPIADFETYATPEQNQYSNINIKLSNGSLSSFLPHFDSITQQGAGIFPLVFEADRFQVNYQWQETYHLHHCTGLGKFWECDDSDPSNQWPCAPQVGSLVITVPIVFSFNTQSNQWDMTSGTVTAAAPNVQTNIPSKSILLYKPGLCSSDHVTDAIKAAIDAIDFATPINALISGVINSIPGSGNLGNSIIYDFSMGDSGILFPNNDGIQMSVKGGASYNGVAFSNNTPPQLPLPLPPADSNTHSLNMYVSNYEIDALNWAFFKAGKLNTVVNASDLSDPDVLKVKTYVASCPPLKPYASRVMQAQIQPTAAPTTSFQLVYELSSTVMQNLKSQLPNTVYNNLTGLQGNNYVAKADLESDLSGAGIGSSFYETIENAAKSMGMVVTHIITYTLIIQDFQPNQPTIVFTVNRIDILSGLTLGLGGANQQNQTMQFQFNNVSWVETFVSSTIPKLDASIFNNLWLTAGEPQYAALMTTMGKTGVPLPIMQGFQFDFTNADLNIQENYISILASVVFNSTTAILPLF